MQKESLRLIGVGVIALLAGFGVCYAVVTCCPMRDSKGAMSMAGMHQMPDGTMMSNMPQSGMQGMMMDMNAQLRGKTGEDFDRAFITEMIVHHQGAVDMAELALKNARHQEVLDLAKAIIDAQKKEISDMQRWEKEWFGK